MISIQEDNFDIARECALLSQASPSVGALVTFIGLVRDFNDGDVVSGLFLEHYPGMTEKVLADIIAQAKKRWPLLGVRIVHRVGQLGPGDQIVFVGVTSEHRAAAFEACDFLMDFLKTKAPFWKKETGVGVDRWVETRRSDDESTRRW